jgi:hypothetical protein
MTAPPLVQASLGGWVSTQRALKKKLDRGERSGDMTAARAARLDTLGFVWAPPRGGPYS